MKQILFIILFSLVANNLNGQCDSISQDIWNIIKKEKYDNYDRFLMPIEQQRKVLHWSKSEETDKMLSVIKDSLKSELISSSKKLREEMVDKGFDLNNTDFKSCELILNKLDITVCQNEKENTFSIETHKTDKVYLMLPINANKPELPTFQPTKEELANSTIIIAGEEFKSFEPSEKEKEKGLEILKICIENKQIPKQNIRLIDGMKDKNGMSILNFMTAVDFKMNRYKVVLEEETCEKLGE